MNILVTALGSYGDVYPHVGLAVRLQQRGHQVTLCTNPFFAELARKYGLDFVPIGTAEQYAQFANHPALFDPRKSVPAFFDTLVIPAIRSAYATLIEHIPPGKTVIVSPIVLFAARLVQETQHVPNVTIHLTPMAFKSAYEMPRNAIFSFPDWLPVWLKRLYWWVADKAMVDRLIAPELNAFRRELGLAPVSRIMTKWGHSPDRVIGLFPPWYGAPQPDWPEASRLTGFPLFDEDAEAGLAPEVQAFLDAGEPPVVFLPGSLKQQAGAFFETAVESCLALGKRAILLSRFGEHIPRALPEGMRHFAYVPFGRLLPHVEMLVHHGGIGTCAQAMKAGVPQLIHPLAYDQYDNAWRLRKLGVGDWIVPRNWRPPVLAEKLQALSASSQVRAQCRAVAGRFAGTDALSEACEWIEAL